MLFTYTKAFLATAYSTFLIEDGLPAMQDAGQPSTANIAIACALVAGVTGYMVGQAKSLGLFGGSPVSEPKETEYTDESGDESDMSPSEFAGQNEECKLVLVVRTDLGMTKGMQCIHPAEGIVWS